MLLPLPGTLFFSLFITPLSLFPQFPYYLSNGEGRSWTLQVELGAPPMCLLGPLNFLSKIDLLIWTLSVCASPTVICEFHPGMDSAFVVVVVVWISVHSMLVQCAITVKTPLLAEWKGLQNEAGHPYWDHSGIWQIINNKGPRPNILWFGADIMIHEAILD